VLVGDQLAADSTTWVNPDGSLTTEVFGSPVRVPDVGGKFGWRDLDFTLVFASDGYVIPRSGLLPLHISGGGSASEVAAAGLVSVSVDGTSFGFGWDGALPVPVLVGDTARFVDVLPDVDLVVRLDSTGFEQFFEVKSHPSQTVLDRLRLLVKTKSVAVTPNVSGGFDFTASGQKLASMVDPSVYDSAAGGQVALTDAVDVDLVGKVLNLSVDENFFDNPDLVYPVIVDPAVTLGVWFDSYVSSAYPNTDFQSATELLVGSPDGGASKYRSFLNFSSSAWADQDIISAELKLYLNWSWSCSARSFSVSPAAPVTGSSRWGATAPAIYGGGVVTKSVAAGYNSSCAATYVSTTVTDTVAYLAPIVSGAAGFALKAVNESDSFAWKRFNSTNASTNKPSLKVTYNTYPGKATTVSAEPFNGSGAVALVGSSKPLLTSSAVDADGGNVTLKFYDYGTVNTLLCQVTVASGAKGSCRPTTPLVDGQSYSVRAVASDSRVTSKTPSNAFNFAVSLAMPDAPTISCPYANGYVSVSAPASSFVCTVSTNASAANSAASTVRITVSDGQPETFSTQPDGSFSQQITLKAGAFRHTILAVATSKSGISSPSAEYVMTFGQNGVVSPQSVTTVSRSLTISAYAQKMSNQSAYQATIWWRNYASGGVWSPSVSTSNLSLVSGVKHLTNFEWSLEGSNTVNAAAPTTIQVIVCFIYMPYDEESCTPEDAIVATVLPTSFGVGPTSSAGPGVVSLTSGAFTSTETDFSTSVGLNSLNVSRTYNNRVGQTNTDQGIFGPGWQESLSSDASAFASYELVSSDVTNALIYLTNLSDASTLTFQRLTNGTYKAFDSQTVATQVSLAQTSTGFTVTESSGAQTSYRYSNNQWQVTCSKTSASSKTVVTEYDAQSRIIKTGYAASTSTCVSPTVGSKGLSYGYTTVAGQTRLLSVTFFTPTSTQVVSQYGYNSAGLLVSQTDPRNSQTIGYEYDSKNRLTKQSVAGFDPYIFRYDTAGRLVQVARDLFGKVENTYLFNLPVNAGGLLPDFSATQLAHWGQKVVPSYAAAVFDAQRAISLDASGSPVVPSTSSQDWVLANFFFTNAAGVQTNTAEYGKTGWLYTATLVPDQMQLENQIPYAHFDQDGIQRVLERATIEGNDNFDELQYATLQSFATQINSNIVVTGQYQTDSWTPTHQVTLANGEQVSARNHVHTNFDENAPTTALYGLPTSQYVYSVVDGVETLLTKMVTGYNPIDQTSSTGSTSGWVLQQPTNSTQYSPAGALVAQSKTQYNELGQIIKTVAPGSNGADGRTELTTYYAAAAQSIHPECGNQPDWETLVCFTEYPITPLIPNVWVQSYDKYQNPLVTVEKTATTTTRTTTNSYLADGRLDTQTVAATGMNTFKTQNSYNATTLQQTGTKLFKDNILDSQTSQTFDTLGRQTSYTNSLGETETTTFVPYNQIGSGAVASSSNPVGVTSYIYGGDDPRAQLTGLTFTNTGTNPFSYSYQASYDELGKQTSQTGPNGLTQSFEYNDSNQIISMTYGQTVGSTTTAWFTWERNYDIYGRVLNDDEPDPSGTKNNLYSYDQTGRLTGNTSNLTGETITPVCEQNSYGYDASGNRLTKTAGNCATSNTTSHSYNTFSQITNTGYIYDALGRNTQIPAIDAPNPTNGNIALVYDTKDHVVSIAQNTVTTFTYDAEGRRLNESTNGSNTVRHYTDSSDNPTWATQTSTGAATKTEIFTPSLGSGLNITTTLQAATKTSEMQLHDLKGNTVTTVNLGDNTTTAWCSYDEYGNSNQNNPTNTNSINYTTYGQAERATNTTGLILMGARVYNPITNQFTSPDPVKGGNENPYTYPNDPINSNDFTGKLGLASSIVLDRLIGLISLGLGIAICGVLAAACQQVIKFVITLLASVVVGLLEGQSLTDSIGEGLIAAGLSLIPGVSKSTFKKIIRVVKLVSKKTASLLKRIKLKKLKANIDSSLSGWEYGSALGRALTTQDYLKELVF
jgi:RHS repeat-associated protein